MCYAAGEDQNPDNDVSLSKMNVVYPDGSPATAPDGSRVILILIKNCQDYFSINLCCSKFEVFG